MRFLGSLVLTLCMILGAFVPSRGYSLQYIDQSASTQLHWSSNTITVALSTSLQSPPSNIKAGSDVVGATQRALAHWSEAANIQFIITTSNAQSVSPSESGGDGINLITVADTPDNRAFVPTAPEIPGRTRAFNDGVYIVEADIAVNPALPFSTDGTPNTYDLESVLTHEIGHMLGLEHSGVISATMQARFARNGLFGLPTMTPRTLSDDDRAGIIAIYGARSGGFGAIEGNIQIGGMSPYGAHVWAEDVVTGRVRGGNIAFANGNYRIDGLPAGQYRLIAEPLDEPVNVREIPSTGGAYAGLQQNPPPPFKTYEVPGSFNVAASNGATTEATSFQNIVAPSGSPSINPTFVGRDGQLSTVGVPLVPGRKATVYVGGTNLTQSQIPASGISITSPFFTVDQSSVSYTSSGSVSVIGFNVTVSSIAPFGDYSIRLASNSGEVAYLAGALTIDLPFGVASGNPITDDSQFFVAQHYRDFLNREPDTDGLNFWTNQIASCKGEPSCVDIKRQNVSAAYFVSVEFQQTGYLVYRLYKAAYGRVPTFKEFLPDTQTIGRDVIVGQAGSDQKLEQNKQAFLNGFVARAAFTAKFPTNLTPEQFVDMLNANAGNTLSIDDRNALVSGLKNGTETRATVLRRVAENQAFYTREFNPAFVLMQYFGYLRRDPDSNGYNFWLNKLSQFNGDYIKAEMVRSFILSDEYKQRFGK